jgi:hypothetical protein
VRVTLASGTTPPEASLTVPRIELRKDCPKTHPPSKRITNPKKHTFKKLLIGSLQIRNFPTPFAAEQKTYVPPLSRAILFRGKETALVAIVPNK